MAWTSVGTIKGPKGDSGEKGDTGDKGDAYTFDDITPEQLARLTGEIPSRSFTGLILSSIAFSLICLGSGLKRRIPSILSSLLILSISFLNSSSVIS